MQAPLRAQPLRSGAARAASGAAVERGRFARILGAHILALAIVNVALLLLAPSDVPVLRLVLASALLWVCAYPTFDFIVTRPKQVPVFPVVNAIYFVYFALPVFLDTVELRGRRLDTPEVTTAVGLVFVGVLIFQLFFYTPLAKFVDMVPTVRIDLDVDRLVDYFLALAAITATLSAYTFVATLPPSLRAMSGFAQRFPLLFFGAVEMVWLRRGITRWQKIVWLTFYAGFMTCALGSGAIGQAVYTAAPLFFVYIAVRGRLPWAAIAVSMAVLVPLNHTKHAFRTEVRTHQLTGLVKIPVLFETTWNSVTSEKDFLEKMKDESANRVSHLAAFAYLIQMTPSRVPYNEGKSYESMLWFFVPRIFALDKPLHASGQEFGHRYGLIAYNDYATTVNLPQIAELYMNFGPAGVLVGMAILGALFRALYRLFNHPDGSDGTALVASVGFLAWLNVESEAAMIVTGAIVTPPTAAVVMWAATWLGVRLTSQRRARFA